MNSEFDLHLAYLQDICKQSSIDSQHLFFDIKALRQEMKQLGTHIQNKNQSILKEITPRIQQLETKMEVNWKSIEKMDCISEGQLQQERTIFQQYQKIVEEMDERIGEVSRKV